MKEGKCLAKERTPYLKELALRKRNCKRRIDEIKATMLVDRFFGKDMMFKRNYAVFSYNRPVLNKAEQNGVVFHKKPDLQIQLRSDTEITEPYKYGKKEFKVDSFSQIYHIIPRRKSPLKRVGYDIVNGKNGNRMNTSSI